MTKLSIITINYNNAEGLEKTIRSVVEQTFQPIEFIIIDGGSCDDSVQIIQKFADKITYWQSEKDEGIYDAQNIGITKATGEYCLFLNSGDYLCGAAVLERVFANNPAEDIVYGDIIYHESGSAGRKRIFPDTLSNYFLITDVIGHQVQFIKRKLFENYGVYDKQYQIVADYEFFIRMIFKHNISTKHVPIFISVFNLSGISSSSEQVKRINDERHTIQRIYFPKAFVFMYHTYASLLQSKLYNSTFVSAPVKLMRNVIFKFIKPATKK